MHTTTNVKSLLLLLVTLLSSSSSAFVAAAPTPELSPAAAVEPKEVVGVEPTKTEPLQHRSVASGGTTCYFTCPTTFVGFAFRAGGPASSEADYLCGYSNDREAGNCYYDRATGKLSGIEDSSDGCPSQADGPNCTIGPTSQNFKRHVAPRELTAAEEAVKKRQFHVPHVVKKDEGEQKAVE